jgi:hypothetical protein
VRVNLAATVLDTVLTFANSSIVKSASDQQSVRDALFSWLNGQSFSEIHSTLASKGVRIGRRFITIDDVVALCESGFGYDSAAVVSALADLTEEQHETLSAALGVIQKRIKYGLSSVSAIAFFEAGFADRVIAQQLGETFANVADRNFVRSVLRSDPDRTVELLDEYPSYFRNLGFQMARVGP